MQKRAYELRIRDWSSDLCSSDRCDIEPAAHVADAPLRLGADVDIIDLLRSEILERREHCAESWRVDAPGPVAAADRDIGEDLICHLVVHAECIGPCVELHRVRK